MALMLITHDLGVVAEMVDEVAVMYAGRIVESGSVKDVFVSPKHPYTQGLLESMPSRSRRGERLSVIKGSVPNPFNMPPGCNFGPRCPQRFGACRVHDPLLGDPDEDTGSRVACWLWMDPPATDGPSVQATAETAPGMVQPPTPAGVLPRVPDPQPTVTTTALPMPSEPAP